MRKIALALMMIVLLVESVGWARQYVFGFTTSEIVFEIVNFPKE